MKIKEELQQDYEKYLDYIRCRRSGFAYTELNSHSIEELEALANLGWSDEIGEELYEIFIRCRKRKMNMQFVFNKENINAIVRVDKQLKECCRQLKKETENLFDYMLEQKRERFYIGGEINICGGNEFLDCAISVLDKNVLSFHLRQNVKMGIDDDINTVSIFDFDRNYADKILSDNRERMMYNPFEDCHIGFAFYELYRQGCLSLQDIVENAGIHSSIDLGFGII